MEVFRYHPERDEDGVMRLMEEEGEEWACYTVGANADKYRRSLELSLTFVAYSNDILCGFVRCLEDHGFYIYVCDLLVGPAFRGRGIGRSLMEAVYGDFPEQIAYVMSDVDPYYEKLGYHREGSVFVVTRPSGQ